MNRRGCIRLRQLRPWRLRGQGPAGRALAGPARIRPSQHRRRAGLAAGAPEITIAAVAVAAAAAAG